jgi:hypothetical protein
MTIHPLPARIILLRLEEGHYEQGFAGWNSGLRSYFNILGSV